jgi:pteridine reductase
MLELPGKVAVVTGAARRIGRAVAVALARAGCNVVINYRTSATDAEATARDARAAGVDAITVQADVARSDDVKRLLQTTVGELGRIDILVANAGAFRRTPLATLTEADWDEMIDDNLRAAFLCAHRFGLYMRAHGGGCIITLADVAGLRPWADYLPYSIAKAGVIALTQGLAKELAPTVRVNAVAPGPILFPDDFDPALQRREVSRTLLQRQGNPDHIADAILALVRNDYITGVVLPVDGGRALV